MNISCPDHFQRLPENILCQIFESAAGHLPIILPIQPFDNIQCTLLLVNKKWNLVAIRTQSIWKFFKFELEDVSTPPLMTATIRQFSVCLERSRSNLVSVIFSTQSGGWSFSNMNSILALCYSRTISLTSTLRSKRDIDAFLSLPPGSFPELQHIDISFVNTTSGMAHTSARSGPTRVFEGAYSLKTAILHRIPNGLNHVKLRLPWSELAHLDLGGTPMHPHTFIKIMKHTSQTLQTAFIFVELNGPLDNALMALPKAIPLQNLTTLRLRLAYPNHDWRILSILHISSLVSFRLEMLNTTQNWMIFYIAHFLQRSSESLRQLHLSDFKPYGHPLVRTHKDTTHTELYDLLNIIPKIDTLRLPVSIPVHATTIESIASGEILKNLRTMEFSYANIWHALDLVRRRGNLSRMSLSAQGCSTAEDSAAVPVTSLASLSLWVPSHQCNMEEVFTINTERRRLVSEGFVDYIHIHPTSDLPLPFSGRV